MGAYRLPSFGTLHAARDAGESGLSIAQGTQDPATPLRRLIDDAPHRPLRFTNTGNSAVVIDRGSAGLTAVDWLWIPPSISLHQTGSIRIAASTDNFGADDETLATPPIPAKGDPLLVEFTATQKRYLGVELNGGAVPQEVGQLVFSAKTPFPTGPRRRWEQGRIPLERRANLISGEQNVLHFGSLASAAYTFEAIDSTTGLAIHDSLRDAVGWGGAAPVLWEPVDDRLPAFWGRLEAVRSESQDHPEPKAVEPSYTIAYAIREIR